MSGGGVGIGGGGTDVNVMKIESLRVVESLVVAGMIDAAEMESSTVT